MRGERNATTPVPYRSDPNYAIFVCLFGFFWSHLRIFHVYGNVTFTGEGRYILTYT